MSHRLSGIGAAAGGVLLAALSQLALAPSASAQPDDPFADVFSDIQTSIATGQADLSDEATTFASGDIPLGLDLDLAGIDNQLFAPDST